MGQKGALIDNWTDDLLAGMGEIKIAWEPLEYALELSIEPAAGKPFSRIVEIMSFPGSTGFQPFFSGAYSNALPHLISKAKRNCFHVHLDPLQGKIAHRG